MQNYGFGALQHPESMTHSIETQDEDATYLQYPCNEELDKYDGLGLQFPDDLDLETIPWPYLNNSSSIVDLQTISHLHQHNNGQFLVPQQQYSQISSQDLDVSQCHPSLAQRIAMQTQPGLSHHSTQVPLEFNMPAAAAAAPSVSSTTTPPHIGPLDYLSPWPTPELEPTTLDEINAWISLDQRQRQSPGSISSSGTSSIATPSYHSRASSLDSVSRFKPSPVQKEKPQCWEHGCNGRTFSTYGNYVRHCKERSDKRPQRKCPRCGALFSRTTARNQHLAKNACNRIRRYSNGRQRPDSTARITE